MLCDANGVPLRFLLSGGQASDISYAEPLLDDVSIPTSKRGRPRKRCRWLLADTGYDADALRRYCDRYPMQPVIPLRAMKRNPEPELPRLFDRPKYRQRNVIERMSGWLKENRRIVTRFGKLAKSYGATVSQACVMRCLRHLFSERTWSTKSRGVCRMWSSRPSDLRPGIVSDVDLAGVGGRDDLGWRPQKKNLTPPAKLSLIGDRKSPKPCRIPSDKDNITAFPNNTQLQSRQT
jgi:transposase